MDLPSKTLTTGLYLVGGLGLLIAIGAYPVASALAAAHADAILTAGELKDPEKVRWVTQVGMLMGNGIGWITVMAGLATAVASFGTLGLAYRETWRAEAKLPIDGIHR